MDQYSSQCVCVGKVLATLSLELLFLLFSSACMDKKYTELDQSPCECKWMNKTGWGAWGPESETKFTFVFCFFLERAVQSLGGGGDAASQGAGTGQERVAEHTDASVQQPAQTR